MVNKLRATKNWMDCMVVKIEVLGDYKCSFTLKIRRCLEITALSLAKINANNNQSFSVGAV